MWRWSIKLSVLFLLAVHGCGSPDSDSGYDVVDTEATASTVETLVLLVSVKLAQPTEPDFAAYDGY